MEIFSPRCVQFWEVKVFINPTHVNGMDYEQVWEYLVTEGRNALVDSPTPIKAVMEVSVSEHIDVPYRAPSNEYGVSTRVKWMERFSSKVETQDVFVLVDRIMENPKTDVAAYLRSAQELSLVLGTKAVGITMKRPTKKQRNLDITSPKFGIDAKLLEEKVEKETRWVVKEVVNGVVIESKKKSNKDK